MSSGPARPAGRMPLRVLRLPVQVYLYSFPASPEYDSTLGADQVADLFRAVNAVWRQAGIAWNLLSVSAMVISARMPGLYRKSTRATFRETLVGISPRVPKVVDRRLWRIAVLRQFPLRAAGAYAYQSKTVFFCEQTLRGETSPVILAHELGHSLGLDHVEDVGNLMRPASGPWFDPEECIGLTPGQVESARRQAELGPKQQPGRELEEYPQRR